jgi:hypothetical protein
MPGSTASDPDREVIGPADLALSLLTTTISTISFTRAIIGSTPGSAYHLSGAGAGSILNAATRLGEEAIARRASLSGGIDGAKRIADEHGGEDDGTQTGLGEFG